MNRSTLRALRARLSPLALALVAAPAALSCGPSGGPGGDGGTSRPPAPPPMICRAGSAYTAGAPAFRDVTGEWGLSAARGVRVQVADVDNDGYPDLLLVPNLSNTRSNFEGTEAQRGALLMNRPRASGGGRRFVDETRASGFLATRDGSTTQGRYFSIAAFADIDNDGDADGVTGVNINLARGAAEDPGDRAEILLNDGRGRFTLAPESAINPGPGGVPQTTGVVLTDYDRDGKLDVFMSYYLDPDARIEIAQQPDLFRGAGDGTFERVTELAGMTLGDTMASIVDGTSRRPLYGASVCDLNGDGAPDLLGAGYNRSWNELFLSTPGNMFTELGRMSGLGGDDNVDITQDQSYLCYCEANPAMCPPGLAAPIYMCPVRGWRPGYNDQPWRLNGNTFGIACGDVDNDGDLDVFSAEIAHPDTGPASDRSELALNNGMSGTAVRFTRPGRMVTGLTPRTAVPRTDEGGIYPAMWDFDGDGRLDIWLGATDYDRQYGWLFHQQPDGSFREVGEAAGFHHACPTGFALADFDRDGDLDVVVGSSRARTWCSQQWPNGNEVHIYENVTENTNWTAIRLVGRGAGGANRDGVGARVRVTAGGVTQTREIHTAWGHFSQGTTPTANFGLAGNCVIERLEVRWPDATGTVETFTNVQANYRVEVRQGEGFVRYVTE